MGDMSEGLVSDFVIYIYVPSPSLSYVTLSVIIPYIRLSWLSGDKKMYLGVGLRKEGSKEV